MKLSQIKNKRRYIIFLYKRSIYIVFSFVSKQLQQSTKKLTMFRVNHGDNWSILFLLVYLNVELIYLTLAIVISTALLFFLDILTFRTHTLVCLPEMIKLHFSGAYKQAKPIDIVLAALPRVFAFVLGYIIVYFLFGGSLGYLRLVISSIVLGYVVIALFLYLRAMYYKEDTDFGPLVAVFRYLVHTSQKSRVKFLTGLSAVWSTHIHLFNAEYGGDRQKT